MLVKFQDTGYRIQDTGYRIQDTGCVMQDDFVRLLNFLVHTIKNSSFYEL